MILDWGEEMFLPNSSEFYDTVNKLLQSTGNLSGPEIRREQIYSV
jgi:hypothetical protein